ncbi:uncharacterized protein LOC133371677 isoform X2 [Rhineura floridana]|uniref:uncharacterized protein LOC133371677 isoform X2 n=1 Tax=Rhineura floridana TaxID=261503 RepID=UPI002AC8529F|nr:uncharacterized protein LOC133371677 isoform X2 [Rhineura floridana]
MAGVTGGKYYVDVQRKEDLFDSCGVIHDEAESLYLHPAVLVEQKEKREHNFADIKLEASLRAYVGSTEECNRKVQKSPEKQKDLEKLIKKMAQDYIPDRTNEGKAKSTKRQKQLQNTPANLHIAASSCMLPEVQRLVSSASKLIVAATSDVSPRKMGTTQGVSSPERKDAKSVQSLDSGSKRCLSTTHSHKDEAQRTKQNQERKHLKVKKRSSDISKTSSSSKSKSKRLLLRTLPKSVDISSVDRMSIAPYSQTGQNEAFKKGILRASLAISEHQDAQPNAQWKNFSLSQQNENSADHSHKTFKIKREESSLRPTETIPNIKNCPSSKFFGRQPILSSRSNQESHSENCSQHNLRGPEDATQSTVPANKSTGIGACLQEDQNNGCIPVVKHGSSFLYQVCQEMDQDISLSMTRNGSMTVDENEGNQNKHLFTQLFSSSEEGGSDVEDSPGKAQMQDLPLGESCDEQMMHILPVTPGACRCSELPSCCVCEASEEQHPGSPVITAAILEGLESEQSEEEFTISSASSSFSARSLTSLHEQMSSNTKEEDADSSIDVLVQKVLKMMPEEKTMQQEMFCQHSKNPSSPAEKRHGSWN